MGLDSQREEVDLLAVVESKRAAAESATADQAARVQAEMTAELDRQRAKGERLAARAAQCAAAGKAAVQEATRLQAIEMEGLAMETAESAAAERADGG